VLYEALTGTRPFEAPTLEALAMRITSGTSTPIESLRPDLPVGLMEVVRHAIAADRAQRLPSAQALIDALSPYRSATTTQISPPTSNDVGLMKTIADTTPDGALSSVSAMTGMSSPGKSKSKGPLAVAVAVGLTVLAGIGFVLTRPREPATISMPSDVPSRQGVGAAPTPAAPALPPSAPVAAAEVPSTTIAPLPDAGSALTRKPSPARPQAPATAAAAPSPTPAKPNLGLSQENPFR
jgi:serine/threonine-protein kinase